MKLWSERDPVSKLATKSDEKQIKVSITVKNKKDVIKLKWQCTMECKERKKKKNSVIHFLRRQI